jgi:hypothetical protein
MLQIYLKRTWDNHHQKVLCFVMIKDQLIAVDVDVPSHDNLKKINALFSEWRGVRARTLLLARRLLSQRLRSLRIPDPNPFYFFGKRREKGRQKKGNTKSGVINGKKIHIQCNR